MSTSEAPAVVVTALREEFAPILRHFGYVVSERVGGHKVFHTDVCKPRFVLACTGDGPKNAAQTARLLCETFRPTAFVGVGVAGALTTGLSKFDLVVSSHFRNDAGAEVPADRVLLSVASAVGARPATLVSTDAPIVRASEKKALAEKLGTSGLAAVDMESAAWAAAAAGAGVPCVVIRAIADGPLDDLPHYLPACLGEDGGIRRGAVLRRALAEPTSILELLALRRRVAVCSRKIAFFLSDFFVC